MEKCLAFKTLAAGSLTSQCLKVASQRRDGDSEYVFIQTRLATLNKQKQICR